MNEQNGTTLLSSACREVVDLLPLIVLEPTLVAETTRITHELAENHSAQWDLEEQSHKGNAPDSLLADLKRQIDILNQRRTRLIRALDQSFLAGAGSLGIDPVWPLTLGQAIDALLIAAIKAARVGDAQRASAQRAHDHLQAAIHWAAEVLNGGGVVLPPVSTVKSY
ncbi:MAG: DUF4254 domain-containing protein [bacterium]